MNSVLCFSGLFFTLDFLRCFVSNWSVYVYVYEKIFWKKTLSWLCFGSRFSRVQHHVVMDSKFTDILINLFFPARRRKLRIELLLLISVESYNLSIYRHFIVTAKEQAHFPVIFFASREFHLTGLFVALPKWGNWGISGELTSQAINEIAKFSFLWRVLSLDRRQMFSHC